MSIKYNQNIILMLIMLFISRVLYVITMIKCLFFYYESSNEFKMISKIFNSIFENSNYKDLLNDKNILNYDEEKMKKKK